MKFTFGSAFLIHAEGLCMARCPGRISPAWHHQSVIIPYKCLPPYDRFGKSKNHTCKNTIDNYLVKSALKCREYSLTCIPTAPAGSIMLIMIIINRSNLPTLYDSWKKIPSLYASMDLVQ